MSQARHFADDLILRLRELGHPLCVGLDPHLDHIPQLFRRGQMSPADPRTAAAMERFLFAVVDRLEGRVAAVKPQIAFFERLGWRGIQVLERVVARVQRLGIAVVLDAKRGDIGSTAQGYADAYLRDDAPLEADAITVSPYLGRETLAPFVERARDYGRGLFVLVKTSNPGAGDLQDLMVDGTPVYERLARGLAELATRLQGPATGWSSLGAVVGATHPDQAEKVRAALPRSLFLIPGYGAQGASAAEAVRGLVAGPKGLEGGLVASSRAILFPRDSLSAGAAVWEKAVDAALERAADELGDAVAG